MSSDYERGVQDGARYRNDSGRGMLPSVLGPLLAFGIPLGLGYFLLRRTPGLSGGTKGFQDMMEMMMPIKKRQFRVDVKGTSFKDVVGIPEAKEEIQQYVDFLKNPKKYTRLGARLPKGCLLTGEPGTGKTLLAKAVAGEAEVPFFSCNGADFIELVGGSGPKRVRELFAEARETAPCIVFIDEIDAVGSRAGGENGRGGGISGEENRTINQLLAELDGLSTSGDTVIVLAATNFQDNIDKALLREGRFDRKIPIEMPDRNARVEVFVHYLSRVCTGDAKGKTVTDKGESIKLDPKVNNGDMAKLLSDLTPGISPAAIAAIVNEAALTAASDGKELVGKDDLLSAIDNALLGKKQRNRMSEKAIHRTAIHEAGHALVTWMLPQQKDVAKISVEPRGNAMGYTQKMGSEFHEYQTNVSLFTDMVVLLGGRAAEDVVLGEASVGAVDDLQRCTDVAMKKMMAFGMSPEGAGLLAYHPQSTGAGRSFVSFSEGTQRLAEQQARIIVEAAYVYAKRLVEENRDKIVAMSDKLLKVKEIRQEGIRELWGERPSKPSIQDLVDMLDKKQPLSAS